MLSTTRAGTVGTPTFVGLCLVAIGFMVLSLLATAKGAVRFAVATDRDAAMSATWWVVCSTLPKVY